MSSEEAKKRGYKPLAKIVDYAIAATEPIDLFYAPVESTRKLLAKMKLTVNDFDLIEVNEAFAAQTLADGKELRVGLVAGQRERRGDRAGAPHRGQRRTNLDDARVGHEGSQRRARVWRRSAWAAATASRLAVQRL
jgi:hypothetical protein